MNSAINGWIANKIFINFFINIKDAYYWIAQIN